MLRKTSSGPGVLGKTLMATLCAAALLSLPLSGYAAQTAPEQTFKSELGDLSVTEIAKGLAHPWALAFLPDKQGILVTERPGDLRVVSYDGKLSKPISGVPQVWAQGQGGLLDVVLSPDFANDRMVYLTYAEGSQDGKTAGTAAGRGRLSADHGLRQYPQFCHPGCLRHTSGRPFDHW